MQALLTSKEKQDPQGWQDFQQQMQNLKLQRTRLQREAEDVLAALADAQARISKHSSLPASFLTGQDCLI